MRLIIVGAILAIAAGAWQIETAGVLDQRGREAFAAGRYRDARTYFDRELRLPEVRGMDRAAALGNASQAHMALGENRKAEEYLREAVGLAPQVGRLWHGLGQALYLQGRHEEAEEAYRRAAEDVSVQAEAWADLAASLEARKRNDDAAALWRKAMAVSKSGQARARMVRNLAVLEWKTGAKAAALGHLREAMAEMETAVGRRHPDFAQVLTDYAEALAGTGDRAASRDAAKEAVAIRSSFAGQTGGNSVEWRELRK